MSSANRGGPVPPIGDLINVGLDYAKSAKALLPYVGLAVVSAVAPLALGGVGGFIALLAAIASIFLVIMASREAITGNFSRQDSDMMAALKLVGVGVLIVIGIIILSIPVAVIMPNNRFGLTIFSLVLMAVVVAAMARIVFIVPALAMGDQSPFMALVKNALDQTAPHWGTLIQLLLITALPGVLFNVLFGGIGGAAGLLLMAIGGVITGFAGLISIGAVARFYARYIARTA